MSRDKVETALLLIRGTAKQFTGDAHRLRDELCIDVLRAIAEGAPNAQDLAAAALETERIEFPRWYE